MHNYKELKIWKKSIDLAEDVYKHLNSYPNDERYNLTAQLRRCSVSIPSNIAEGAGRNSDKDFMRFLGIALGSAFELQTHLILSNRLKLLSDIDFDELNDSLDELMKMIWGFKKSLESNVLNLKSY